MVRTFTEGEVRASLVFQLSKLASILLVATRSLAGVTPWDTLVTGTAVGRLVEAQRLDVGLLESEKQPVVLLLREADGDEEVGAAGPCVKGIILTQELPHLSHLGESVGWLVGLVGLHGISSCSSVFAFGTGFRPPLTIPPSSPPPLLRRPRPPGARPIRHP